MTRIKAHFDGRVIVPDEPVDLPPGEAIIVDIARAASRNGAGQREPLHPERFIRSFHAPVHPPEVYRREHLYRDDV